MPPLHAGRVLADIEVIRALAALVLGYAVLGRQAPPRLVRDHDGAAVVDDADMLR